MANLADATKTVYWEIWGTSLANGEAFDTAPTVVATIQTACTATAYQIIESTFTGVFDIANPGETVVLQLRRNVDDSCTVDAKVINFQFDYPQGTIGADSVWPWVQMGDAGKHTGSSGAGDYTYILALGGAVLPDTVKEGQIRSIKVWATVAGTCKFKVFDYDGANFLFRGESDTFTLVVGWNVISTSIPIRNGGFLGFYANSTARIGYVASGAFFWKAGDVIVDSAVATWTAATATFSLAGWMRY